jgi:hypothetical protein
MLELPLEASMILSRNHAFAFYFFGFPRPLAEETG